jgi:FkbM family methyltransferase
VYDIGANLGYLALASAQMVGAGGRVFAFEADPRNVEALRRTVRDNRVSNVSIEAKAVAESSGTLEFATFPYLLVGRIADEATPRDAQIRSVESVSLDDFVAHGNPAPSLLKIDVEGAEARVLAGAENLLHEARPLLIVEVRPDSRAAVESLTSKCGYRGRPLHGAEGQVADMLYVARD